MFYLFILLLYGTWPWLAPARVPCGLRSHPATARPCHDTWLQPELANHNPNPCVQSLRGPGQTAEALLLKYARATQQRPTDPVTYSMR